MIYYKRKSWIKKLISKTTRSEISFPPVFALLKAACVSFFGLILLLYSSYLFLLPKFVTEENVENILNNYLTKNTKLTLDVENIRVAPDYKFDINIKADKIQFNYSNKKAFLVLQKPNVDINLLTLFFNYIDLNKIKADKIIINTNFTKAKHYNCFDYFDLDILNFNNLNTNFKLRNVKILCDDFLFNLYDENIKKSFYIKAKNIKFTTLPDKPFNISAKGYVSSANHKISDFNLNLELLLQKNTLESFKNLIQKLNYNPLAYADKYSFYSYADVNLKVLHNDKKLNTFGSVNLKDYSFIIEGIKLPKNDILILFKGDKIKADCNFNFIKNQFIKLNLEAALNKNLDLKVNSNDINLTELKEVINVFCKIFNPKINSKDILLSGLINCNMHLRSDFKTITSKGNFLVKNAKLAYKPLNVEIESINSNINLDNNKINILNTSAYIDKSKFYVVGSIDDKTNLNLKMNTEAINIAQVINLAKKLPLPLGLDDYVFKNGVLKANAEILGNIKTPIIKAKANLNGLKLFVKSYKTNLSIKEILMDTKLENDAFITINNAFISNEFININTPKAQIKVLGDEAELLRTPIKMEGINAYVEGKINLKNQIAKLNLEALLASNNKLFIVKNKNPKLKVNLVLSQTKALIEQLSIFDNSKTLLTLSGSIDNFDTLNHIKININERIGFVVPSLDNLSFEANGTLDVSGKIKTPDLNGNLTLYNVVYNNFNLYIKDIILNIKNSSVYLNIVNAKVLDFNFDLLAQAKYLNNKLIIAYAQFNSPYINLDKIEKYSNKLSTPIEIQADNIKGNIQTFEAMGTLVNDVSFEGNLNNDVLNVSKFSANAFNGEVKGNLTLDLKTFKTHAEVILKEVNVRHLSSRFKEFSIAASGKLSALITADFTGFDFDSLLRTLNGYVKFNINDGELNQFAKFERFLQAGNILSQSVLKLTLNSAISAITNQNTGDFKTIEGTVKIKDTIANIQYIKTQGTNMSMYITGTFNLLNQFANLKVLGRIPSNIVNVLGNIGSFSGDKLVDKMPKDAKEIINTITVSPIERMMSTPISEEDISNIPPLVNLPSGVTTREFIVRISGASQSAGSVKYFKWRQRN